MRDYYTRKRISDLEDENRQLRVLVDECRKGESVRRVHQMKQTGSDAPLYNRAVMVWLADHLCEKCLHEFNRALKAQNVGNCFCPNCTKNFLNVLEHVISARRMKKQIDCGK